MDVLWRLFQFGELSQGVPGLGMLGMVNFEQNRAVALHNQWVIWIHLFRVPRLQLFYTTRLAYWPSSEYI
jgi:hypothetical protein